MDASKSNFSGDEFIAISHPHSIEDTDTIYHIIKSEPDDCLHEETEIIHVAAYHEEPLEDQLSLELDIGDLETMPDPEHHFPQVGNSRSSKRKRPFAPRKRFVRGWLTLPEFKSWLSESETAGMAFCKVCKKELLPGKSELRKHACTNKHATKMEALGRGTKEDPLPKNVMDLTIGHSNRSKDMLKAMTSVNLRYRMDDTSETIEELEKEVCTALGKEAGFYCLNPIMANRVALLSYRKKNSAQMVCGRDSQIYRNLLDSPLPLNVYTLPDLPDGMYDVDQLANRIRLMKDPVVICVEDPHLSSGGVAIGQQWLQKVSDACKVKNIPLHCDGTRFINAATFNQQLLEPLCKNYHSVVFGLECNLGGPAGCVLVGSTEFIRCARLQAKCLLLKPDHRTIQYAAGCLYALARPIKDVIVDLVNAKTIAKAVQSMSSNYVSTNMDRTQTNIVTIYCRHISAEDFVKRLNTVSNREGIDLEEGIYIKATSYSTTKNSDMVLLATYPKVTELHVRAIIKKLKYLIEEITEDKIETMNREWFNWDNE